MASNFSPAGVGTANQNYTFTHEAGHLINYQLQDKFEKDKRFMYGTEQGMDHDEAIANAILTDSMIGEAAMDRKLDKILRKHAGIGKMDKLNTAENYRKIADALKQTKAANSNKRSLSTFDSGSALLSDLRKKGYTSIYGASHGSEMYAEAFSDHYRNETKADKYSRDSSWLNRHRLKKLAKNRNRLSDRIVSNSQAVFKSSKEREKLLDRFFVDQ